MSNIPIVVADDDVDILRMLEKYLADAGFTVLSCSNGEAAFDLIVRHKPALLLADWEMPGMTGVELCTKIRQSKFNANVYIIMLTAHGGEERIVAGLDAGADDYITKPARHAELLARVQAGTRILHMLSEREEQAAMLRAESEKLRGEIDEHQATQELLSQVQIALDGAEMEKLSKIEERERVQERLSRIQMALDDSGHAIAIANLDGHLDYMNIAFSDLFHCTLETINEGGWESLFVDGAVSTNIVDSITCGDEWCGQAKMLSRKGRVFPAEIRAACIVSDKIEVTGVMFVINDITERQRLEQELLHARKLEAIGQLAAGIAHEINTPTQYIGDNTRFVQKGFVDLIKALEQHRRLLAAVKEGVPEPELVLEVERATDEARVDYLCEEIPEAITEALEGIDRVAEIVRAMKEFSHPGVEGKTETDINRAVQSTVTVATNEWKYIADMKMALEPDLPQVLCLAGEFNQVVLNILVNASHAIADVVGDGANGKGTITVSTRHDGDCVEIRIQDTGPGIAQDAQARIFDSFYTTKDVGKGTGQGLSIAHAVITRKHGGTISVDSAPGKGATFIIRLPISPTIADTDSEKEVSLVV